MVILAGGVGSRFWPVSTPTRPKQLLALAGDEALIAQTMRRVAPLLPIERILVLTGEHLVEPIRASVPELGADSFLIEPRARGTAPVLVWAAHELAQRDANAVMVSLHADHVIQPEEAFRQLLADAAAHAAATGRLFTIGVEPSRPETGYGYIKLGNRIPDSGSRIPETPELESGTGKLGAFEVERFVEKPDRPTAEKYVDQGYLWNSGLFV